MLLKLEDGGDGCVERKRLLYCVAFSANRTHDGVVLFEHKHARVANGVRAGEENGLGLCSREGIGAYDAFHSEINIHSCTHSLNNKHQVAIAQISEATLQSTHSLTFTCT